MRRTQQTFVELDHFNKNSSGPFQNPTVHEYLGQWTPAIFSKLFGQKSFLCRVDGLDPGFGVGNDQRAEGSWAE